MMGLTEVVSVDMPKPKPKRSWTFGKKKAPAAKGVYDEYETMRGENDPRWIEPFILPLRFWL